MRGNDRKWERCRELVATLSRREHAYDFVCLQELFATLDGGRVKHVCDELRAAGFCSVATQNSAASPHSAVPLVHAPVDSGLLIASRLPIVEVQFHEFEATGTFVEFYVGKGILFTKIDMRRGATAATAAAATMPPPLDSECLFLFNTHLCAERHSTRIAQLQEVDAFVRRCAFAGREARGAIVLCGDFNIALAAATDDVGDGYDGGGGRRSGPLAARIFPFVVAACISSSDAAALEAHALRRFAGSLDLECGLEIDESTASPEMRSSDATFGRVRDPFYHGTQRRPEARRIDYVLTRGVARRRDHIDPMRATASNGGSGSPQPYQTLSDHSAVVLNFCVYGSAGATV